MSRNNTSPVIIIIMLLSYLVLFHLVKARGLDTNSTIYTLGPVEKTENNITFTSDTLKNAGSSVVNVTESPDDLIAFVLDKAVFSDPGGGTRCTSPMIYDQQRQRCVKRRSFTGDGSPVWRRKRR